MILRRAELVRRKLDVFFAGRLYWSLTRWIAERRLERVLEQDGDQSMEARRATEWYRRADFAVRYWRSAPRPVMQVVKQARKAGIPIDDLRLIVVNADLRIKGERVHLRRSFTLAVLNAIFATIVAVHMFLMCILAVTAPAPISLKIVAVLMVGFVYCLLYHGWSLYSSRPQQVIAQYGLKLDDLCAKYSVRTLEVTHIGT